MEWRWKSTEFGSFPSASVHSYQVLPRNKVIMGQEDVFQTLWCTLPDFLCQLLHVGWKSPKKQVLQKAEVKESNNSKKNKCLNAKKTKSNKACDVCDDLKIQHSLKCNDECWSKVLGEVRHIHQHCWVLSQKHPMTQHIQGWTLKRKVPLSTVLRWFLKRNWYNSISIHTLLNSVNSNLENSNLWPMTYDLKCSIEIACT